MKPINAFVNDETGATAIEYSLIASFISIVIVVSVGNLGSTLNGTYNMILNALR